MKAQDFKKVVATIVAALTALLMPLLANAQSIIEEITVTAQKREQAVQDVGIAMTVLTGDQLQEFGFTHSMDVTSMAPNVQMVQPNGPSSFNLNIRGVVQTDFADNQEPPVAVYVDEVYVSQMSVAGFQMYDLERVEILRGPQGTLFGRNATGGLAHYLTREPTQEFEGYVKSTVGRFYKARIESGIGGPLTNNVSWRLSGVFNRHDPYVENRIGPDLSNGKDFALRGQLLFQVSPEAELLLKVEHAEQDIDTGFFKHRAAKPSHPAGAEFLGANEDFWTANNATNPAFGPGGFLGGVPAPVSCAGCDAFGYRDPDDDPFVGSYDFVGFNDLESTAATATFTWNFGGMDLTSVTGFSTMEKAYQEDSDASPNSIFHFFVTADVDQYSEELRLSGSTERTRWVTGLYYLGIDGDYSNGGEIDSFALGSFPGGGLSNPFSTKTDSYAVFAQVEHDLSNDLTFIAGGRYTRDEKEHTFISNFVAFPQDWSPVDPLPSGSNILLEIFNFTKGTVGDLAELNQNLWSAKAELDWRPSEDILFYASWNRGVKGGGFNAPLDASGLLTQAGQENEAIPFGDETLNAFEVGLKTQLANGKLQINGAAFYYDYSDYQAFKFIGLTKTVFNADAEIYGMDIEIAARPVEALDLRLGVGLLDTKVKNLDFGFGLVNRNTANSPSVNLSGSARYTWLLGEGTLSIHGDFRYLSDHNFSLPAPPALREDGYAVANARVTYALPGGGWEVSAFVENFTNTEYRVQVFDVSSPPPAGFGMVEEFYGKPRWWGISLTYHL